MPDTPNTIETKILQNTVQPAAQTTPQTETQETPPADTTPVLKTVPPPHHDHEHTGDTIQEVISSLSSNVSEVGNWFENNKMQLITGGISTVITVLFFFAILLSLRHVVSLGIGKLSASLGKLIRRLSMHISLLFLLTGLSYSNSLIEFPHEIEHVLNRIFFALFIIVFLAGILSIINAIDKAWSHHFRQKNEESYATSKLMLDLIRRIIKTVVWFIAILFILQNVFHVEITPLLTGAGVVGVAIAFAAQNTIANLFGAFSILGCQLFKVGDWVKIGDAEGTVEQIGLRSIRLRAFEGRLIDIPNRVIADTELDNFSNRDFYRECFTFSLVYQTTPKQMERALKIISEVCADMSGIMVPGKPPRFAFVECADFALKIQGYIWFKTTNFYTLQDYKNHVNMAILKRFNEEGLSFAYPTSTVFLAK